MPENFPSKKFAAPNEPTEGQSDFINTILDGADFKISDYSPETANNQTIKPENEKVAPEIKTADSIIDGTPEENAALIKRFGQPTMPGIEVVEPISKLNISTDALKSTPVVATEPTSTQIRLDKRFAPSTREEERARAREASKITPWWRKLIGG